ncbi:sugar transferase [uncultured Roseovarius sp.]|uniref:sugar transferase n=1 Tax=uncultured Roseovarius sp. TaxID=293344 RepID=UPI002616132D|nr:sugar transferase [uncultured Roseovarius sp.]
MSFRMIPVPLRRVDSNFNQRISLHRAAPRAYSGIFKRLLDIAIVVLVAPPVLMVVGILALLVARDGASPFFSQDRVGQNGRVFRMWKLRSMVVDAEAQLESYLASDPLRRREWDDQQKLRHDPRITPIGRFIRKTSLDELPQLWNVLTGDMSIVGPRPMMPSQEALYPGRAYYALRPGITGYWQISVRNESSFAERAQFDTRYFRDLSLVTDIRVMLGTFRVVLSGTGC